MKNGIFLTQQSRTHFSHHSPSSEENFDISSVMLVWTITLQQKIFLTVGSGGQGQLRAPACFLTQLMHLSIHAVWVGDQQVTLGFELHLCGHTSLRAWAHEESVSIELQGFGKVSFPPGQAVGKDLLAQSLWKAGIPSSETVQPKLHKWTLKCISIGKVTCSDFSD